MCADFCQYCSVLHYWTTTSLNVFTIWMLRFQNQMKHLRAGVVQPLYLWMSGQVGKWHRTGYILVVSSNPTLPPAEFVRRLPCGVAWDAVPEQSQLVKLQQSNAFGSTWTKSACLHKKVAVHDATVGLLKGWMLAASGWVWCVLWFWGVYMRNRS